MARAAKPEPEPQLDRVFAALSDPVRRAILTRLKEKELLVSELAKPFDISLQAVSRHIQVLVRAGLIHDAAVWINRYSTYWQSQFETVALWLDRIERDRPSAAKRSGDRSRKKANR
jgi:DNA-binding transcriptional ArsR family regulator